MRCNSASNHVLSLTLLLSGAIFSTSALAQEPTTNDSTVTYPAEFFAQYEPFSVNDMLDRIPGIDTARGVVAEMEALVVPAVVVDAD